MVAGKTAKKKKVKLTGKWRGLSLAWAKLAAMNKKCAGKPKYQACRKAFFKEHK